MLSVKRSSDLKRKWAIWEFKALLHQEEAKEAMANKRAKIIHSRKDLNAKVGCAKAVMKAKYDYRMAVQEARMTRCSQPQETEAAYSEGLSENATTRSTPVHNTLQGTCETYAQVGGTSPKYRK